MKSITEPLIILSIKFPNDPPIMKEKDIISIFLYILFFFIYCIRKAKIAMVINIKNIL